MWRRKHDATKMKPLHYNLAIEELADGAHPAAGGAAKLEIQFHAEFPIEFQIQRLEDVPLRTVTAEPWPVPAAACCSSATS